MNKTISHLKTWWYLYALGVFTVGILTFAFVAVGISYNIRDAFDDKCRSEGNHPIHGRGLLICVSPDGRIVDS